MAPQGWLDVHGHFYLPMSEDERRGLIQQMHQGCFMTPDGWTWSVDDSISQMDMAGVQMQMLSYLPPALEKLKIANDFATTVVQQHPTRFGLLCALPTDDPNACLEEIERAITQFRPQPDGFAVTAVRNDVMLSDARLEPVWSKLESMGATVFSHPNAYAPARDGRPSPLIEVAFETCRVAVDMLYRGVFKRYPNIKFVFAHTGGALPALSGRLELLGAESWVPNPERLTPSEIHDQLAKLYVDCAATAATGLQPAIKMVGEEHVLYGADCGVPCSTHETMLKNRASLLKLESELGMKSGIVGQNGWRLFPTAAKRVEDAQRS